MSKFNKRLISLILSACLTVPLLVSCGESPENADTEVKSSDNSNADAEIIAETEPEEEYLTDGLPDTDFAGYEFRIAYGTDDLNYSVAEDYTGTPVVDAVRESTLYIEDRFNVKVSPTVYENSVDAFKNSIVAGDNAYDISFSPDWAAYPMSKDGYLTDLFTIEQFDFTKPWWPSIMIENLSVCGSLYCSSNYISYLGLDWTRVLFVNKNYAERYNLALPYDTVREGAWTLDAMISYVTGASTDLNGDGKIDANDEVGFTTGNQTFYCLQDDVGIKVYTRDADDIPCLDFDVDRVDVYVTKMRSLMESDDYINPGDFYGADIFRSGKALLEFGILGLAYSSYREADFTYGFLPAPKFDENQESYISCCTDRPMAIPITAVGEQLDIIGTVCEALSCRNYNTVLPVYFESTMKSRLADAPDDAEMLQLIADTRMSSFGWAYELQFRNILGDIGNSTTGVASYYQRNQKAAEKNLEKLVKAFEKIKENAG